MSRPLLQKGIAQLETLFTTSQTNVKVLKQLEHELQFRQVPRALALLEQVQAAVPAAGSAPELSVTGDVPMTLSDLWAKSLAVQPMEPLPSQPTQRPSPQSVVLAPASRLATVVASRLTSSMTCDDACKILKVSLNSPWQEVERARRQLVQLSHPERVAALMLERRVQVRAEAQRINAAYAVLSAMRTH